MSEIMEAAWYLVLGVTALRYLKLMWVILLLWATWNNPYRKVNMELTFLDNLVWAGPVLLYFFCPR